MIEKQDLFKVFLALKTYCLKNDIWDIVLTEDDIPYVIKWEENMYIDEMMAKVWYTKDNVITNEDLLWFIDTAQNYSILPNLKENLFKDLSSDFSMKISWKDCSEVKVRVNVWFKVWKKITIVMRIINSWTPPKMDDLWLVNDKNTAYRDVLYAPFGMVLVVWPTWSGKSMSLTAMLWHVNENMAKHIITFEDPIEFEHVNKKSRIEQREVWVDVKSYAHWLHEALRQKPHVCIIWETRDAAVFTMAQELALTWHVVMTTLHANSVVETIWRILWFFDPEQKEEVLKNLAESLTWIFVQKLMPKEWGWKILVREVLIKTENVKKAIQDGDFDRIYKFMENGSEVWMMTNDQCLEELYKEKKISWKTVATYATNKKWAEQLTWVSFN